MDAILRLSAGHLWLLMFGVPAAVMLTFPLGPVNPWLYRVSAVAASMLTIVFWAWLWSLGRAAHRSLPRGLQRSTRLFSATVLFLVFSLLLGYAPAWVRQLYAAIHVPLFLVGVTGFFYAMGFAARCLVSAETGKKADLKDYLPTFLLIWCAPLGLWSVQRRAQALLRRDRPNP